MKCMNSLEDETYLEHFEHKLVSSAWVTIELISSNGLGIAPTEHP